MELCLGTANNKERILEKAYNVLSMFDIEEAFLTTNEHVAKIVYSSLVDTCIQLCTVLVTDALTSSRDARRFYLTLIEIKTLYLFQDHPLAIATQQLAEELKNAHINEPRAN